MLWANGSNNGDVGRSLWWRYGLHRRPHSYPCLNWQAGWVIGSVCASNEASSSKSSSFLNCSFHYHQRMPTQLHCSTIRNLLMIATAVPPFDINMCNSRGRCWTTVSSQSGTVSIASFSSISTVMASSHWSLGSSLAWCQHSWQPLFLECIFPLGTPASVGACFSCSFFPSTVAFVLAKLWSVELFCEQHGKHLGQVIVCSK